MWKDNRAMSIQRDEYEAAHSTEATLATCTFDEQSEQGLTEDEVQNLTLDLSLDAETEAYLAEAVERDCSTPTDTVGQNQHHAARSVSAGVPGRPADAATCTMQEHDLDFWEVATHPSATPPYLHVRNASRCISPFDFTTCLEITAASTGPSAVVRPREPVATHLQVHPSPLEAKIREQEFILRRSMDDSIGSESRIREWDRAQGLRFCHSKTTLATSRSRVQFVNAVFGDKRKARKKRGRPRKKSVSTVSSGIGHAFTSTARPAGGSTSPEPGTSSPPRRVSESTEAA